MRMRHGLWFLRAGGEVRGPGYEVVETMRDFSLSRFPNANSARHRDDNLPGLLKEAPFPNTLIT